MATRSAEALNLLDRDSRRWYRLVAGLIELGMPEQFLLEPDPISFVLSWMRDLQEQAARAMTPKSSEKRRGRDHADTEAR